MMPAHWKVFVWVFGLCLLGVVISTIALDDYVLGKLTGDTWIPQAVGISMFKAWPLTLFVVCTFGAVAAAVTWLFFEERVNKAVEASEQALNKKHREVLDREKRRLQTQEMALNARIENLQRNEVFYHEQYKALEQAKQDIQMLTTTNEQLELRLKNAIAKFHRIQKKLEHRM